MDPTELSDAFRERPALHRFPGTMAERAQALCAYVAETYDGDAARAWTEASDGADLRARLLAMPGIGEMKANALIAILAKRFGVRPPGWEAVMPKHPTLGDVDSAEALAAVPGPEARLQGLAQGRLTRALAAVAAGDDHRSTHQRREEVIELGSRIRAEPRVHLGGLDDGARGGHQPVEALRPRQPRDRAGVGVAPGDALDGLEVGTDLLRIGVGVERPKANLVEVDPCRQEALRPAEQHHARVQPLAPFHARHDADEGVLVGTATGIRGGPGGGSAGHRQATDRRSASRASSAKPRRRRAAAARRRTR